MSIIVATIRTGLAAFLLAVSAAGVAQQPQAGAEPPGMVRIEAVEVGLTAVGPVVLLKAQARAIPVFVDQTVAESIHAALTRQALARPLSHDLMRAILAAYGGKVTRVTVSLKGATYYGALSVDLAGAGKEFDARSSDAIALAVLFSAPIYVSRTLLDSAGESVDAAPGSQRL